jgi:hypothetical protein
MLSKPGQIVDRVTEPDRVVASYEWFRSTYQHIQALQMQVMDAEAVLVAFRETAGPRDKWDYNDKQEEARLRSIALGLKQQRQNEIAEYNARASQISRNFTLGDLPSHLN